MHYHYIGTPKNNSLFIRLTDEEMNLVIEKLKHRFDATVTSRADKVEIVNMFLTFDLSSYKDYKESTEASWREKFYDSERIISLFTPAQSATLAVSIFLGHVAIKDTMAEMLVAKNQTAVLYQLNAFITTLILSVDEEINLMEKILAYSMTLSPPILADFGKREQDSPEYSFNKNEVNMVHAIVIVAKIYLPLFAALLKISKEPSSRISLYGDRYVPVKTKAKLIDKRIKEIYCLSFIEPLFYKHIETLYMKLLNYMEKFIEVSHAESSKTNSTQTFRNNIPEELLKIVSSYLLCRRCVKYNLSSPSTNIMGFIWRGARNVDQLIGSNEVYFTRTNFASDESPATKESTLELGSTRSKVPADEALYVEMMAKKIVKDRLERYNIDRVTVFEPIFHYNVNLRKEVEPFFEMILNNAFSADFESCYCVKSLNYLEIIELMTLVQIICFQQGYFMLCHRLFARRNYLPDATLEMRNQMDDVEGSRIRYNVGSYAAKLLDELRSCYTRTLNDEKKVTSLYDESKRMIETAAKYFTDYETYYQTSPMIVANMKLQSVEGKLAITTDLIEQFCKILEGV